MEKYNIHFKNKEQKEAVEIDLLVTGLPHKPKDIHEKLDVAAYMCHSRGSRGR